MYAKLGGGGFEELPLMGRSSSLLQRKKLDFVKKKMPAHCKNT